MNGWSWVSFLAGAPVWGSLGVLTMAIVAAGARDEGPPCCGCCHQEPGKQVIPCERCPRHRHLVDEVGFTMIGLECPHRQTHRWTDESRPSVEGA